MTKGRNTSVVSVRLPDEVISRLKKMAKGRRKSMTELLRPVIGNFAIRGRIPSVIYTPEPAQDVIEEPPDLELEPEYEETPDSELNPDYWAAPQPKFEASPSPKTRNKAKAKRKAKDKKKRH